MRVSVFLIIVRFIAFVVLRFIQLRRRIELIVVRLIWLVRGALFRHRVIDRCSICLWALQCIVVMKSVLNVSSFALVTNLEQNTEAKKKLCRRQEILLPTNHETPSWQEFTGRCGL